MDIVERLRDHQNGGRRQECEEAADTIEQLRAKIVALEAAAPSLQQEKECWPEILFDGNAVYQEVKGVGRERRNSPESVSDTLDAIVRILRRTTPAASFARKGWKALPVLNIEHVSQPCEFQVMLGFKSCRTASEFKAALIDPAKAKPIILPSGTKLCPIPNDERDLVFLQEMQQRLNDGRERRDPGQLDMVATMIADWINELSTAESREG